MLFYVAVRREAPARVEYLYRCGTLAAALEAYHTVRPGEGQSKALLQRDPEGWHILALTDGRAEDWTVHEANEATEHDRADAPADWESLPEA